MIISDFFSKRPIFAGVLSTLIFLVGAISIFRLPAGEYPGVVPPTVIVRAVYPGANPKTIAETVAAPLEQSLNGVENSIYSFSQATSDGVMTLMVTFKLGTDLDKAQVQNRVAQAEPKLLDNKPAVAIPISQLPGSNAIAVSTAVRNAMAELKPNFPDRIDYAIAYDPTVFVRNSIEAVVHTLL